VTVRYGCRLESFTQDESGVTARVKHANGTGGAIGASYLVGCDGGGSTVRKQLGIKLRGEYNILELRQALYRCDELFECIPIGNGPGKGRHYHVADGNSTFLIMQDSTKHFTLHALVEKDDDMKAMFERTVAISVKYEMLTCAPWRQNLLLADRYRDGRVFLAGDAVHLVIPTGGLGMNSGVGDAIDLPGSSRRPCRDGAGPRCSTRTTPSGGRSASATSAPRATLPSDGASGTRNTGRTFARTRPKAPPRVRTSCASPASSSPSRTR